MNGTFVLVRHGESEWNKLNLFTGWKDPDLSQHGREEAIEGAKKIASQSIKFDICFTSALQRAQHTTDIILENIEQQDLQVIENEALNERDYGDLSGLNKDDARKKWGEEQVQIWRRSFDVPPPGGESLKMTLERVLPYFNREIKPFLSQGKNVLLVAHGNSLRSLIMDMEKLSKEEIVRLELATGVPIVYKVDENVQIISKEIL